jgi:pimeloyl-ACP methyl ester carboxylesterase
MNAGPRQTRSDAKENDQSEPIRFADWIAAGQRVAVELPAANGARRVEVFTRVEGKGPWLNPLHGFPTSSMDWAQTHHLEALRAKVRRTVATESELDGELRELLHALTGK